MEEILSGFKPLFSRVAAYARYVVIIIGLMIRSDRLGREKAFGMALVRKWVGSQILTKAV